jgi:hypothetical protein
LSTAVPALPLFPRLISSLSFLPSLSIRFSLLFNHRPASFFVPLSSLLFVPPIFSFLCVPSLLRPA